MISRWTIVTLAFLGLCACQNKALAPAEEAAPREPAAALVSYCQDAEAKSWFTWIRCSQNLAENAVGAAEVCVGVRSAEPRFCDVIVRRPGKPDAFFLMSQCPDRRGVRRTQGFTGQTDGLFFRGSFQQVRPGSPEFFQTDFDVAQIPAAGGTLEFATLVYGGPPGKTGVTANGPFCGFGKR